MNKPVTGRRAAAARAAQVVEHPPHFTLVSAEGRDAAGEPACAAGGLIDTAVVASELDKLISGRARDLEILKNIAESMRAGASKADIHRKLLLLARSSREAFQSLQTSRDALISLQKRSARGDVILVVDDITGLPNRAAFEAKLEDTFQECASASDAALMLIEIGALPLLTNEAGQRIAAKVVKRFAAILKRTVKHTDFIARVSPQQFAIIFRNVLPENVASIALRIHDAMQKRLVPGRDPVMQMLHVAIGITGNKPEDRAGADLLERAQGSLVMARKQTGAGIYVA